MFPNLIIFKKPFKLLIQQSLLIYPTGEAAPACKKVTLCPTDKPWFSAKQYMGPWVSDCLSPIPWINQLNSRRGVLGAAPSPTSVQGASWAPKVPALTRWLPWLQIEATHSYTFYTFYIMLKEVSSFRNKILLSQSLWGLHWKLIFARILHKILLNPLKPNIQKTKQNWISTSPGKSKRPVII